MDELEQRGGITHRSIWAVQTGDGLWQVIAGQHQGGTYAETLLGDPCPAELALRTLELNQRLGWRL